MKSTPLLFQNVALLYILSQIFTFCPIQTYISKSINIALQIYLHTCAQCTNMDKCMYNEHCLFVVFTAYLLGGLFLGVIKIISSETSSHTNVC